MFDKIKKAASKVADGVTDAVEEFKDDTCSWKKVDSNSNNSECGHLNYNPGARLSYKHCPYCGEKIHWHEKEVEDE